MPVNEKDSMVRKITAYLKAKRCVQFAYIFGSFAEENSFNDIDLGIFVSKEEIKTSLDLELEMERELADLLHIPVDVRILNSASPAFTFNVLKSGYVIVDDFISLRADFEGAIFKKYNDYRYLRDEYLRGLANAAI